MLRLSILLATSLFLCLPAAAENKGGPIKGTHGMVEIAGACANAGGSFQIHEDAGGYGCTKKNCDGKGGDCHVSCDNGGNCQGSTPARIITPVTMLGLLQNGNNVYYQQSEPSGAPPSLSGGGGAGVAAAPAAPSAPPPVIIY